MFAFNMSIHAYINCNGAGGGYEGSESPAVDNNPIEALIVEGGCFYLEANSYIQILLRTIEGQDREAVDFEELRLTAENAFEKMDLAVKTYENLVRLAESTPYNQIVISKLVNFDYDLFMQQQALNPAAWKEVEEYLKNGDITGVFKRVLSSFSNIASLAALMKSEISQHRLPPMPLCWQLNEKSAGASLFGSYVARVFDAIQPRLP
jgi:hypothetical protein